MISVIYNKIIWMAGYIQNKTMPLLDYIKQHWLPDTKVKVFFFVLPFIPLLWLVILKIFRFNLNIIFWLKKPFVIIYRVGQRFVYYLISFTSRIQKNKLTQQSNPTQNIQLLSQILNYCNKGKYCKSNFNLFSMISPSDRHRLRFRQIFSELKQKIKQEKKQEKDQQSSSASSKNYSKQLGLTQQQSRSIAVMMGMAINDALGASTEFIPFKKQGHQLIKEGFQDVSKAIKKGILRKRHGQIGIWTDDASMGLVMGYGLMINDYEFDPIINRKMFHLWWHNGLGNGGRTQSVGLGGNISISIDQFIRDSSKKYTSQGNRNNNGNGSLMRLAPIPVVFQDDSKKALQVAKNQSRTTHNGLEAMQCSRLMTQIIINLIKRKANEDWREVLLNTCNNFKTQIKSVQYLAKSKKQTEQIVNKQLQKYPSPNFAQFNKSLADRNWNWQDKDFTYSPTRLGQNPGYVGSYCMDALAMALHVVYNNDSFKAVATKIADQGGDCDTVGSIAGQIAGAIYGVDDDVLKLYSEMQDFQKGRYQVFLMGYKLYHRKKIGKICQEEEQVNKLQNKEQENRLLEVQLLRNQSDHNYDQRFV